MRKEVGGQAVVQTGEPKGTVQSMLRLQKKILPYHVSVDVISQPQSTTTAQHTQMYSLQVAYIFVHVCPFHYASKFACTQPHPILTYLRRALAGTSGFSDWP